MDVTRFQSGTLVAWLVVMTGCTVCHNAMRTVCHEPAAFSWKHDRRRSVELYRQWADQAWAEELSQCPELFSQGDYAVGFRDGFVDFVYAGGTGEPPPVPPRQFWNAILRSPDGRQRADQWFAGYRHGAQVARDGGYREMGTIRTSLVSGGEPLNSPMYPPDSAGFDAPDIDTRWRAPEVLPEPGADLQTPASDSPVDAPAHDTQRDSRPASSAMPAAHSPELPAGERASPSDLPDDLSLPVTEPGGNAGNHFRSIEDERVEAPSAAAGSIVTCSGQLDAISVEDEPADPPRPSSTIRLLAQPIRTSENDPSNVLVQLIPTRQDNGLIQNTNESHLRGDGIPAAATNAAENVPAESTIRIRQEKDPVSRPSRPLVRSRTGIAEQEDEPGSRPPRPAGRHTPEMFQR
jgi:hypothetical protein